jgi:hypothetical protein
VTSVTAVILPNVETLNSQPLELLSFVTFRLVEGSLVVTFAISNRESNCRFHQAAQFRKEKKLNHENDEASDVGNDNCDDLIHSDS